MDEESTPAKKIRRNIPKTPYYVLDAPSLRDDFYSSLLDWSSQNVLAVGLGTSVYMWSPTTTKITKLCDLGPGNNVCSVQWTREGTFVAVGTTLGEIQIWDGIQCKKVRNLNAHDSRTGVLAWNSTFILASGSKDKFIRLQDIRASPMSIAKLGGGHKSEVCSLKWSHDDRELASGGNDDMLLVWNLHLQKTVHRFSEHNAAIKAITWSPHQHGVLASGGGTADKCICIWNTINGDMLRSLNTGSQVCNLEWCKNANEIISTHGFPHNQIVIWNYPSMGKVATLTGHSLRVLYLAMSPDRKKIVTGAGDETLRFWDIFPTRKRTTKELFPVVGLSLLGRAYIR